MAFDKLIGLTGSVAESDEYITSGSFKDFSGDFVYENLPPFRRVRFVSSFCEGSHIISEIWLPDNWNGILLSFGNGGAAGKLDCIAFADSIKEGYAVSQTDMGTSGLLKNKEYYPDLLYDFALRSTHICAVVSKEIIKCHYGRNPDYSYFSGGSTGGRQAFREAVSFPEDYNGYIARVPSTNALFLTVMRHWCHRCLHDKDGKPLIDADTVLKITGCVTDLFQKNGDGEKGDDFITHPYLDENTLDTVINYIRANIPEMTDRQLSALRKVYDGPINPETGERIFCGIPFGSEIFCPSFRDDGDFDTPWYKCYFGADFNNEDFDFSDHLCEMLDGSGKYMITPQTDYSKFNALGNKMIFYSGSADPLGPFAETLKYYNRICRDNGGYEKVSEFMKCFVIPGKEHSNGGRGVNTVYARDGKSELLADLRAWVEKGISPEYIIGAHIRKSDGTEKFRRKIYPYKADKKEGIDFPYCTSDSYLDML